MSSWSEGYVSDINYTFGYYSELNPNNAIIPFLMAGLAVPKGITENQKNSFACELGFGQGLSLNIHATSSGLKWYGTDFNPSQTNFAQHLSSVSDNNAFIVDQGFNEFCRRDDLPEFDFIGLHGIWSWISDENRAIVVDFIRRKLKVGGILYISYNTLPGWSALSPLRHLLLEHHNSMTSMSNSRQQNVQDSLNFVGDILSQSHQLTQKSPDLLPRVQELKEKDLHYIAHEYLNKDWQPMYFADMKKWLEPAKLTFACSTNYLDDFSDCLYTQEQRQLMESFTDTNFAQTVKDFLLNKQFRKDLWVKGARKLTPYEQSQEWKKLRVLLHTKRENIELSIERNLKIPLNADIFNPVLDILQDQRIHKVADIVESLKEKLPEGNIFAVLAILAGKDHLVVVQSEEVIEQTRSHCLTFNRYVLQQSRAAEDSAIYFLASPITGGAYHIGFLSRWFLLARFEGIKQNKWSDFVWDILKSNGRSLLKDGNLFPNEAQEREEMQRICRQFIDDELPKLKLLGII